MEDKILGKIKKCLALSKSDNPHEAASALRQAQKLMEKHGVSNLDLKKSDIGEAQVKSKVSVSKMKDWELKLLALVGKAFGCKLLWYSSSSYSYDVFGHYTLIGLKDRVELAHYTCEVLQRKIVSARSNFVRELPNIGRRAKTLEADGFCHGWVQAIGKTVYEFAMDDETRQLIESVVEDKSSGKASPQRRQRGRLGESIGYEAGSQESIHKPMAERKKVLLTN